MMFSATEKKDHLAFVTPMNLDSVVCDRGWAHIGYVTSLVPSTEFPYNWLDCMTESDSGSGPFSLWKWWVILDGIERNLDVLKCASLELNILSATWGHLGIEL